MKFISKPPNKINSDFTSNSKKDKRTIPEPKKPFNERIGIWGYTVGTIGLGIAIGVTFGAYAYSLTATTDEKLKDDIIYYKEQRRIADDNNDSLKSENKKLLSEKKELQEQLTIKENENNKLSESLNSVNEDLKQYKDKELTYSNSKSENLSKVDVKNLTSKQTEIKLNDSVSFFGGKIYVSVVEIGLNSTNIQITADGYDSEKFSGEVGSQFKYECDSKYQIRIIKIDFNNDTIVVQAKEL